MHQSKYAIGAIVDDFGRVAVCSEYAFAHAATSRYSLSVERYLGINENPMRALFDQMGLQLGIEDKDIRDVKVVTSSIMNHGLNAVATREIHLYVFKFEKPMTIKPPQHTQTPIEFCSLDDINEYFDSPMLRLSYCGERMKTFINGQKHGKLKTTFG